MRLFMIGLALVFVAGCGGPADNAAGGSSRAFKDPSYEVSADAAASATDAAAASPASAPGASPAATVPVGAPMLAYSYRYGIETPAGKVRELAARHEAACAAAGPALCQVTSSSVDETGEDSLMARLELRAAPAWLKRFRNDLAGDAKAAGGRVTSSNVSSEDLSRQIVDTEARLRAMTTLRDRLQALLADRPGKLSDLVEIERELARVQGDIDSTTSQLAVMRGRVAMSEVTLNYRSRDMLAPSGVWSPLVGAFTDFIGIVAFTLAAMVRLVAWLLPWVLVGGGLIWLFRKRLPKRLRLPWGRAKPADGA
ncbi:MAG: DUF4349 domain-containing protein [Caulobacter sp.]|nr:DUF4349 domain-containing protein [Caulobacter sp.]